MLNVLNIEDDDISTAAMLHDICKIGIPDTILLKTYKLSVEEYEIIKMHTIIGYKTLYPYGEIFPFLKKLL